MTPGAVLALALTLMAQACATGPSGPWQTSLGLEHLLTGRIWDVSAAAFVEAPVLARRLAGSRFVLLGEQHDNPDHHRLQAWLLRQLVGRGRRPALAFEMIDINRQAAISRFLAAGRPEADGLAQAVGWAQSGWPDWALYRPIAEAALEAGLPILAADLPPSRIRRLSREGLAALPPALVAGYGLDRPLPPEHHRALAEELQESHCGGLAEPTIEAMIRVQRARDAHMAERVAADDDGRGAVLIAGAGHVRNDRGIPAFLAARLPGARVTSVAFVEVAEGKTSPPAYAERYGGGALPFDYLWFTPRVDDLDPCQKYREQIERLRRRERGRPPAS